MYIIIANKLLDEIINENAESEIVCTLVFVVQWIKVFDRIITSKLSKDVTIGKNNLVLLIESKNFRVHILLM